MDEHDATLRRRGELPPRSPDEESTGIEDGFIGAEESGAEPSLAGRLPATLAPPDLFGEEPATAPGSPAHGGADEPAAPASPEAATQLPAERPPHPPGGEIWVSAIEDEGEGELGLESLGDDEGILPG